MTYDVTPDSRYVADRISLKRLLHVKNLNMFNSKGDNFTDKHFKASLH